MGTKMKYLTISLLVLSLVGIGAHAQTDTDRANIKADCVSPGNMNLGNGVTCVISRSITGTSKGVSSGVLDATHGNFVPPTSGDALSVFGYLCTTTDCTSPRDWQPRHAYGANSRILPTSNNPCGYTFIDTTPGTSGQSRPTFTTGFPCPATLAVNDSGMIWTAVLLTITDSAGSTCYGASPNSPQPLQLAPSYLNWHWYCPSIGSAIRSITLKCTVANSCSFISIFSDEYRGMCNIAPCFDQTATSNGTGTSMSASATTNYAKELITYLSGTVRDESLTASGGCQQLDQYAVGNMVAAATVTVRGAKVSCGATLNPSDHYGMLMSAIKSAGSRQRRAHGR